MSDELKIKWKWIEDLDTKKAEALLTDIMPIPKSEVSILAAAGGVGKSFLSIQMALEYSNRHQGNVGLWLSEDSEAQVGFRRKVLKEKLGIKDKSKRIATITIDPEPFIKRNSYGAYTPNYEVLEKFIEWAAALNIKFLIIDPIINFFGGNENDSSQARMFTAPFVKWAHETGITILFIHHSAKGGTGPRGSSDFQNGVKCVYGMDVPRDNDGEINKHRMNLGFRQIKLIKDNMHMAEYLDEDNTNELRVMPEKKKTQTQEGTYDMPIVQ